jgi:hypothetical protein
MVLLSSAGATLPEKEAREPRATFQTDKPSADMVACLVPAVSWMSVPSVSPAGEGRTRIVSDVSGVIVLAMMIIDGPKTTIEIRTKVPGRLRRSVESCL